MKLGQLIWYDMRSTFLEKSCTKCGRENFPDPFLKNQNWAFLTLHSINPLSVSVAVIYKPVNWFAQQINSLVSIWGQQWHLMTNWPHFIGWLPLLLEILGNICVVIICFPIYDVKDSEIKLSFLIKLFSKMAKKIDLIKKLRLVLKFMTPSSLKQIITIHILPNISRSKDKQIMKFGQLMQYNVKNNFLQKL